MSKTKKSKGQNQNSSQESSPFELLISSRIKNYALDAWWRMHFSIPYESEAHKSASLISMMVDFYDHVHMNYAMYADVIDQVQADKAEEFTEEEELSILKSVGLA